MARKYLLSIDGGGIKGIIPLCLLVKLEKELKRPGSPLARRFADRLGTRTAPSLLDVFDFVAGTSTGSIIVAGIEAGLSAERMLQVYIDLGRTLFSRRVPLVGGQLSNNIERAFGQAPYSIDLLKRLIADFTGRASQLRLDDCPTDVMLTGKGIYDGRPWYFVKNRPGHNSCRTGHLKLVDCVTASAAAPLYFNPWQVPENEDEFEHHTRLDPRPWRAIGKVVDGGVGIAGNPVYQACVEAFDYSGGEYDPDETTVVSIGTGAFDYQYIRRVDFQPDGLVPWVEWIVEELLRSPSEQQTELAQRHYQHPSVERQKAGAAQSRMYLYRLNVYANRVPGYEDLLEDIDMADADQIEKLVDIGQQFAEVVDWPAIIAGTDKAFLVDDRRTTMEEYGWPAEPPPFWQTPPAPSGAGQS